MLETRQPKVAFMLEWSGTGLVLDLGCNDGGIANSIRQGGASVVAADRFAYAREARRKYSLPAVALDANHGLPFRHGAFDGIVISGLLEYLDKPAETLAEARRVLNPGGRLVLIAANRESLHRKFLTWRGHDTSAETCFGRTELRRLLIAAGFDVRLQRSCAYRIESLAGRILYTLEWLLPWYATDFGFVCEAAAHSGTQ
jgi:SAM-dependent methyltransferase